MTADLLPESDLATDTFGVPVRTVAEWRRLHQWPHEKFGNRIYYTPDQLAEIVRKHAVAGGKLAPKDGRTERSAARSRGS